MLYIFFLLKEIFAKARFNKMNSVNIFKTRLNLYAIKKRSNILKFSPNFQITRFVSDEKEHDKNDLDCNDKKAKLKQKRLEAKSNRSVGLPIEELNLTDYYFENGLRKVYPYYHCFRTSVKERWVGRNLIDIYKEEFANSLEYDSITKLFKDHKIKVNDEPKPNTYKLKNGDFIVYKTHRHEKPVLDDDVKIVFEDENYLVVDKPCSFPIHSVGRYNFNTLLTILDKELKYSNLRSK